MHKFSTEITMHPKPFSSVIRFVKNMFEETVVIKQTFPIVHKCCCAMSEFSTLGSLWQICDKGVISKTRMSPADSNNATIQLCFSLDLDSVRHCLMCVSNLFCDKGVVSTTRMSPADSNNAMTQPCFSLDLDSVRHCLMCVSNLFCLLSFSHRS